MGYTGGIPNPLPEEQDIYGRDLFHDGNLRVTASGDYQTVDGIENLNRSLRRRYAVSPLEYKLRPNYGAGLRAMVKKPLTPSLISEMTDRLRTQTLRDRRIERVDSVTVTREEDGAGVPFVRAIVVAIAFGRRVSLGPFIFSREAT